MTNIDKRIDEIMELDKARTQGEWELYELLPQAYEICAKDNYAFGGVCVPVKKTNAQFIAKAPEMASIIRELQAQVVERDRVIAELRDGLLNLEAGQSITIKSDSSLIWVKKKYLSKQQSTKRGSEWK